MIIKNIDDFHLENFEDLLRSAVNRNLVLVIGAGVSKNVRKEGGKELPDWKGLLREIATTLPSDIDKKLFDEMISQKNYLEAADYLSNFCKDADIHRKIYNAVDKNISNTIKSEWHKNITILNPRIIVTTNYDRILEKYFRINSENDNNSLQYQVIHPESSVNKLVRLLRQDRPVLIKMHGTCDDSEEITGLVLSSSQYSRNISKNKKMYDILRSLLLTKTFLFLGYSIDDPDFRMMLQETKYYEDSGLRAHHYMISSGVSDYRKNVLEKAYDIRVIEYSSEKGHEMGYKILGKIAEEVQSKSFNGHQ